MNSKLPPATTYALIERHRGGDKRALASLFERYYPRVERIVRVRLGPSLLARETVADAVQDVFVRILKSVKRFDRRTDASFIDWVARLTQNEIANHARRERAKKRGGATARRVQLHVESMASGDLPDDTTGVVSKVARREEVDRVDQCVSELSKPHRDVILFRDYHGGDWKTVAELMRRPSPEACQELHRRARRELEKRLRKFTA